MPCCSSRPYSLSSSTQLHPSLHKSYFSTLRSAHVGWLRSCRMRCSVPSYANTSEFIGNKVAAFIERDSLLRGGWNVGVQAMTAHTFLPGEAGEVSCADLPLPKQSRFGFAQAGGGIMSVSCAHDPSARYAGTSPSRNPQRGGRRESMRLGYGRDASKMPGAEAHHG